jgi:Tol biopolymer transport system component
VQITRNASFNTFGPSISADGQRIAFFSAANITGGNPDNSFEIVVHDRASNDFTQVSNHTGGGLTGGHQSPQLSADGQRVVFQRFQTGGGTASFQTLLHDLGTGVSTPLTPLRNAFETSAFSGDGRTVAIASGNIGVRLFDVPGATLGPVIAGNTLSNALSFDGRVLASEGFGRLDVLDRDTGLWRNIAPAGSGFNLRPDLSDDGRWLAFTASYDPLGLNADRNGELFLVDLQSNQTRQITQTTGNAASHQQVSISGDGTRLAFISTTNPLGTNADGNQELFTYDVFDDVLTQLTVTSGSGAFSLQPSLNRDGTALAFVSAANLTGGNPGGVPQLFRFDLAPAGSGGSVPVPGTLPLLALAGGLLMAAARRRSGPWAAAQGV